MTRRQSHGVGMEEFSACGVGFRGYGMGDGPGWFVEICLKILSLGVEGVYGVLYESVVT